jgi:hypothetical protein
LANTIFFNFIVNPIYMKKVIGGIMLAGSLVACQDNETTGDKDFTGNETVYALTAGSEYDVDGTVTLKEKTDGSTVVIVALSGTEGSAEHPVHIHLGDISAPGADVYALLNPVVGSVGTSETTLTKVADESAITYQQLVALDACMKVHLAATGESKDIILAGGNIGSAVTKASSSGRVAFGVCKSE